MKNYGCIYHGWTCIVLFILNRMSAILKTYSSGTPTLNSTEKLNWGIRWSHFWTRGEWNSGVLEIYYFSEQAKTDQFLIHVSVISYYRLFYTGFWHGVMENSLTILNDHFCKLWKVTFSLYSGIYIAKSYNL